MLPECRKFMKTVSCRQESLPLRKVSPGGNFRCGNLHSCQRPVLDWMGDARERFQVGDHILVRILDVQADSPEQVIVHADVKSVEGNTSKENMKKCKIQENTPELWKTSIKAPSLSGSPSVSMPLPTPAMTAGQSGKKDQGILCGDAY